MHEHTFKNENFPKNTYFGVLFVACNDDVHENIKKNLINTITCLDVV